MAFAKARPILQVQLDEIAASVPRFFNAPVSANGLAPRAVAIAGHLDHPVYDCFYLALAEKEQANFVTADLQLVGKVRGTAWQPRAISLSQYNPSSSR